MKKLKKIKIGSFIFIFFCFLFLIFVLSKTTLGEDNVNCSLYNGSYTNCLNLRDFCDYYSTIGTFQCNRCVPKGTSIWDACPIKELCSTLNGRELECANSGRVGGGGAVCYYIKENQGKTCGLCVPTIFPDKNIFCQVCQTSSSYTIKTSGPQTVYSVTWQALSSNWGVGSPLSFNPPIKGYLDKIELLVKTTSETTSSTSLEHLLDVKLVSAENPNINLTEVVRKTLNNNYTGWVIFDFVGDPMVEVNKNYIITFKEGSTTSNIFIGRGINWDWSYRLYIKACLENSPTATNVPPTNTLTPTPNSNPSPTANPNCLCQTSNNTCSDVCNFIKLPAFSYNQPIICQREAAIVGPTISSSNKNQYCQRPKRTKGDADGSNIVDEVDYLYYLRSVLRVPIPAQVNADFNGDGLVSPSDLEIWLAGKEISTSTLTPTSFPTPNLSRTPTPTPTPADSCSNGTNCEQIEIKEETDSLHCQREADNRPKIGQPCINESNNLQSEYCANCGARLGCYSIPSGKKDCGCADGIHRLACP